MGCSLANCQVLSTVPQYSFIFLADQRETVWELSFLPVCAKKNKIKESRPGFLKLESNTTESLKEQITCQMDSQIKKSDETEITQSTQEEYIDQLWCYVACVTFRHASLKQKESFNTGITSPSLAKFQPELHLKLHLNYKKSWTLRFPLNKIIWTLQN